MGTVLMAWELGEGLGHVQRLLRVGRPLADAGHRLVFALCNVAEPWPLFQREPFPFLQAPYWNYRPRPGNQPFLASSLADVLAVRGWESFETLYPLVAAWQQLLDQVKPDLMVADHAPTACLTAFGAMPVVQVGSWFALPPVHKAEFPLLVPGQPPVMPQGKLLEVAQEVQRRRGRAVPESLTAILAAGARFPMFLPELDPYQAERQEPVWDPLEVLPAPDSSKPQNRFFAYLTADNPHTEAWLTEMALTGCRGTVYVRNAPADLKERLRLQGLDVLDEPANLTEMLAQCSVVVHHAGSTANAVFAGGKPQVLFPQHLEQITTARLLERLGVGIAVVGSAAPRAAGRALTQVLRERRCADNAALWARRLEQRERRPALPAVVQHCLGQLRNPQTHLEPRQILR